MEILLTVSHFKHETFSVLPYIQDFGTIVKESMKRTVKWSAKYYANYLVPQKKQYASFCCFFHDTFDKSLDSARDGVSHEAVVKRYSPVRQRAIRSETTKDRVGALPPPVHATINQPQTQVHVDFAKDISDRPPVNDQDEIQHVSISRESQPTVILSRQPQPGYQFCGRSSCSRRPMRKTTTFHMSSQSTEGILRCLVEVVGAIGRLINARGLSLIYLITYPDRWHYDNQIQYIAD